MGRAPCCDKTKVKRGPWSPEEDAILKNYLEKYGTGGNWIALPLKAGLKRCGKSCRLRWVNYLRPDIKHGGFTEEEDNIICALYGKMGSRWSAIASQLPGRTDNGVKNHWNTKLKKLMAAKNNITRNNHSIDNPTLHASTPLVPKSEAFCHSFSASLIQNSPTMPSLTDFNYGLNFNSTESMDHDHIHFPLPGRTEASQFGLSGQSIPNFSPSQEGSRISVSSTLAVESSYGSCFGNGGDLYDGLSMGSGKEFPYDLVSGIGSKETILEAFPISYENLVNSFFADTKPQGLCQTVTNQYN